MNYVLISPSMDAYDNLALDEYLLNTLSKEDRILYFYVNRKAVIIGRNQNPWLECNLNQLNADGVQLVRRISGGGCVYHDEGNLNFSFMCHESRYDEGEQTGIILKALRSLGIHAETTGRNDIAIDGRKFSGNAYCRRGGIQQRHGTLLVNSDLTVFDRYLKVPEKKMVAKGVKSVRSRITKLMEYKADITTKEMMEEVIKAYSAQYGEAVNYPIETIDNGEIARLKEKSMSWEWKMGEAPAFDYIFENRFDWGTAQICLTVKKAVIEKTLVFSDSLDASLSARMEGILNGVRFEKEEIQQKLVFLEGESRDIAEYILGTLK
ncbi:MAG: lipoate--protein ligase [Clostridia bacterium]|nr:lipoate--protein ligase [Clostridia bacterium]